MLLFDLRAVPVASVQARRSPGAVPVSLDSPLAGAAKKEKALPRRSIP